MNEENTNLKFDACSNASYPAKSVHTALEALALTFFAVLGRPEDLPYHAVKDIVFGEFWTVVQRTNLNFEEKQAFDELEKKFQEYWNSLELSR